MGPNPTQTTALFKSNLCTCVCIEIATSSLWHGGENYVKSLVQFSSLCTCGHLILLFFSFNIWIFWNAQTCGEERPLIRILSSVSIISQGLWISWVCLVSSAQEVQPSGFTVEGTITVCRSHRSCSISSLCKSLIRRSFWFKFCHIKGVDWFIRN